MNSPKKAAGAPPHARPPTPAPRPAVRPGHAAARPSPQPAPRAVQPATAQTHATRPRAPQTLRTQSSALQTLWARTQPRPEPAPPPSKVARAETGARRPTPPAPPAPRASAAQSGRTAVQRKDAGRAAAVQRTAARSAPARAAQATRFYPNLHPGAVERVETGSLFRLESFTDQYRLRKTESHGAYVPNQQYNFVRTAEGQMLLHNRYRHPSIAEGRKVLYAGEVFFNNGRLEWWSNGSGHYQPDSDAAAQAGLPLDSFYTYQQVIKGEHKRRGGQRS